jgi:hypothetical protein
MVITACANILFLINIHRILSIIFDEIERISSISLQKSLKRTIFATLISFNK